MAEPSFVMTKFRVPLPRSALLQRPRLFATLDQSCAFPLTLLSAPAGFGKSTLLSAWADQGTSQVAWLSLDEQDTDPARFWTGIVAALRHGGSSHSSVGEAALAMLQAPQPPQLASVVTSLINELAELSHETTLILDDYHLISEQAIHESVRFLLEHLPPCLHLILASRGDPELPLARLRAQGQVVEIREVDLRLSGEEATLFLTQVMGLALSDEDISRLEARTEGWIAGLQLAAISLRRHDDMSAFTQAFSGSHRFILDYVHEEILEPLPEAQRRFLVITSVLDRMNAEVCQVLTGEQASQQILESLERANLFIVPLDEERRWYRLHTLFRDVLLARLQATQPEQVTRLHRAAAVWYHKQEWPHEALHHAMASQDFFFAADVLEGCAERLFLSGEMKTLLTWIKRLPDEVLGLHPRLATNYMLAFNLLFPFSQQQLEERAYLRRLQEGVEELLQRDDQEVVTPAERDLLQARLRLLSLWSVGTQALALGDVEQVSSAAELMQHLSADDDDDAVWRQHSWGSLAIASRLAGNFTLMVSALQTGKQTIRRTQYPSQEVHVLWGLILALIALGQLRQAWDHCQELHDLVNRLGVPVPLSAYPDLFEAQLAYEWNNLGAAKNAAQKAIAKTRSAQYMDVLVGAYDVLSAVCIADGDLTGAERAVREIERVNRSASIPLFCPWIESLWVRLWLAQGRLSHAEGWVERAAYRQDAHIYTYTHEIAHLALVRIDLARCEYAQALQRLTVLLENAENVLRVGSIVAILALQVVTLQASGALQEAVRVLYQLLALAEPEGYLRVFLDAGAPMYQALQTLLATEPGSLSPVLTSYARSVLDAFASERSQTATEPDVPLIALSESPPSSRTVPPLAESLTQREHEVLGLLAQGASNQEIADQLVVTLTTVKKHVGNVLLKLAADNRTRAVARARELSLL